MSLFIPKESIPVSIDGGVNTIYIKPKLDLGGKTRVQDAANSVGGGIVTIGAATLMLLVESIIDWSGPDFIEDGAKLPCIRANIERLDPDDPLVERAAEEVGKRNAPKATSPNSLNGGSASSPASSKGRKSAVTMST